MFKNLLPWTIGLQAPLLETLELAKATGYGGVDANPGERGDAESIGDVEGKTALIVDDFTLSAGTLTAAAAELVERGARSVYAAVSHGVFAKGSTEPGGRRSPVSAEAR